MIPLAHAGGSPWEFHLHPDVLIMVVLLAAGYMLALRYLGPRELGPGEAPATGREKLFWGAGLLTLWVGAYWPVHEISEGYLFSVHMVQHMLFSFVAPPLLLMGLPKWLWRALFRPPAVMRVVRVLTRPLVALVAFNAFVAISHWPALVNYSLTNGLTHFSLHFVLVGTSLMMWWPVVDRLPELARLSDPTKMLYLFLQSVLPTVPASFLTFAETPIYSFYATVAHPWVDAVSDQRLAGLVMKLGGGALLWTIIAVLFFKWNAREERQEEAEVAWDDFERELDVWELRK